MNRLYIVSILLLTLAVPAFAEDTCELAATLAEKGVKSFAGNKAGCAPELKSSILLPSLDGRGWGRVNAAMAVFSHSNE